MTSKKVKVQLLYLLYKQPATKQHTKQQAGDKQG